MKTTFYFVKNQSAKEAVKLLENDPITYSVLSSILQYNCSDIYTDYENIIICFSRSPYPVWVWCRDIDNEEYVTRIGECLKEVFPLEDGYTYNISYDLLNNLKEKDAYFNDISIKMNLLSYRLDELNELYYQADGQMELASIEDIEKLTIYNHDAIYEMEGFDFELEHCRKRLLERIEENGLYVWRNSDNEIVAMAHRGKDKDYFKIAGVYTLPEYRRKGYALNLIWSLSKKIMEEGKVPILYTNADYEASNSCYKKIGYKEVGSLCTIEKKR